MNENTSHWRPGPNSQWVAAVAANLNGWGGAEFVGLCNYDGGFYAYVVDGSGFHVLASNQALGGKSAWINMVAGNFDADAADELIALRGADNGLYMYEYDGTATLRLVASYVDTGSSYPRIDLVAGDFDSDAQAEIMALREGGLSMFKLQGSELRLVAGVSHSAGHKWTGMTRSVMRSGTHGVTLISDFDRNLHLYCYDSSTNTIEWRAIGS